MTQQDFNGIFVCVPQPFASVYELKLDGIGLKEADYQVALVNEIDGSEPLNQYFFSDEKVCEKIQDAGLNKWPLLIRKE